MLTDKDRDLIRTKQVEEAEIIRQLEVFRKGIPFVKLEDPAIIGNGILRFSEKEMLEYSQTFNSSLNKLSVLKFVPASGAASRMFKFLFSFLDNYNHENETLKEYINKLKLPQLKIFFENIEKFPFYQEVLVALKKDGFEFTNPKEGFQAYTFVKKILTDKGLNYGSVPKGLLPFHTYKSHKASAFEEHLNEAALYGVSLGEARLHFTISESHRIKFETALKEILQRMQEKTGIVFHVSFSFQKGKTDTIAVDPNNELFRTSKGDLVFRPSGHGALIENLNDQDADLIFIKNIDNVVVENLQKETAFYKKVLAGKCLEVQKKAFDFAKQLDANPADIDVDEIINFLSLELNVRFSENLSALKTSKKIDLLKSALNRPIRVCGMVKNQGEPGGGPFWVSVDGGKVALQIVESSQINKKDKLQQSILKSSTHFNPVDLVCGVKNYKGESYNLLDFVDTKKGFITSKTFEGRQLKGLELPGLWNGGMAGWNTVFVEVPLSTFNPVKTVIDLLKEAHQSAK